MKASVPKAAKPTHPAEKSGVPLRRLPKEGWTICELMGLNLFRGVCDDPSNVRHPTCPRRHPPERDCITPWEYLGSHPQEGPAEARLRLSFPHDCATRASTAR